MVEFNKERTIKRLKVLGYSPVLVDLELSAIANLHPDLQAVFDAWLRGEDLDFEFKGISLSKIKEKEGFDFSCISFVSLYD